MPKALRLAWNIDVKQLLERMERGSDGAVAQICNLLYRQFSIGKRRERAGSVEVANDRQNGILRYSRLKICATILAGALLAVTAFPRLANAQGNGISAGLLSVIQNDTSNNTESVTVTATVAINGFFERDGSNRGDYNVQFGAGFNDDVDSGVVMASIAQNGRDNGETNYPGMNYCTPTVDYSKSGGNLGAYYVSSFNAPAAAEYNINVAVACFSYSNWIGGFARNSGTTNGGANNLFSGSPGLILGTHFVDNGGGNSTVNLTSLGIYSTNSGILLVTHGKNEDNYASSMVNSNNCLLYTSPSPRDS